MDPLPGRNFAALFKLAHYRFARALALAVGMVQIGSGGWRRTYRSPTGSGPEGSSPNEPGRVFVQPPTGAGEQASPGGSRERRRSVERRCSAIDPFPLREAAVERFALPRR